MSILDSVRSNLQFRVNSLKSMVMGTNNVSQAEPLKRRQRILERRREALRGATERVSIRSDDSVDVSATHTNVESVDGGNSSVVTEDRSDTRSSEATTFGGGTQTPSMSEINKGTLGRAKERGFDN